MSHFALLLVAVTALPEAGTLITYQGHVAPLNEDHLVGDAEKTFDLTVLISGSDEQSLSCLWLIDERGRGAWPWLERFGRVTFDAKSHKPSAGLGPSLLYDWGENQSVIELAPLLLAAPEPLAKGTTWKAENLAFHVTQSDTVDDRPVWNVAVNNNYGWKYDLASEQSSGLLLNLRQRVFMGRGDEYELRLRTLGTEQLATDAFEKTRDGFNAVLAFREQLGRDPRTQHDRWTSASLARLKALVPLLEEETASTVLASLVRTAKQSLTSQNRQADLIAELAKKQLGRAVDDFSIVDLDHQKHTAEQLEGMVTVLHFWRYRDRPLKEPYGQVGYLDFLHEQHRDQGLKVYGVAVDGRFNDAASRGAAVRSVRKLREFMHLGYPILLDGGELIRQFGDPRLIGAELPLYVVIGRDGHVLHYHVGMHTVERDRGLSELDGIVVEALSRKTR